MTFSSYLQQLFSFSFYFYCVHCALMSIACFGVCGQSPDIVILTPNMFTGYCLGKVSADDT